MKEKYLIIIATFIIVIAIILASPACNRQKTDNDTPKFVERVVAFNVDSIGLRDPIWPSFPSDDIRLIDIKLFSDTIFLFSLIQKNDSMRLYTYFWDSIFHFLEERIVKMNLPRSEKEEVRSIAAISYDTLLLLRLQSIEMYDFSSEAVHYSYQLKPSEILLSNFSPVQYCNQSHSIYSEYIDYGKLQEDKEKLYKGSMYSKISIAENRLLGLPFYEPKTGEFRSQYAKAHFALTNHTTIIKYNFSDEFEVYDRFKNNSYRIPIRIPRIVENDIPSESTTDSDVIGGFIRHNATQEGLSYNKENNTIYLFYTMPLPERDEDGLKPNHKDKPIWIIAFDEELRPKERLVINRPGFWSTMQFTVANKIFLLSNQYIYTIKL